MGWEETMRERWSNKVLPGTMTVHEGEHNSAAVAMSEERQEAERAEKHSVILVECATAREDLERAETLLIAAKETLERANSKLDYAFAYLASERGSRPDWAYPSPAEMAAWEARVIAAEATVQEAKEARRTAEQSQADAFNDYRSAQERFGKISFQERQLRRRPDNTPLQTLRRPSRRSTKNWL